MLMLGIWEGSLRELSVFDRGSEQMDQLMICKPVP